MIIMSPWPIKNPLSVLDVKAANVQVIVISFSAYANLLDNAIKFPDSGRLISRSPERQRDHDCR